MPKNIVALGDLHCGHIAGLTPPEWWVSKAAAPKARAYQQESWQRYEQLVNNFGKRVDVLVVNGDAIDGRGERSGSVELITTDRNKQADMAVRCLEMWKARKVIMTYGTPYHTGQAENFENRVAEALDADIANQQFVEIEGVVFSIKHKPAGTSGVPHGRHTGVARDRLWNVLHADLKNQPKADVILRSHAHYHAYAGGPGWLAMILPALQGPKSRYGERECVGVVDWGVVYFTVNKGSYTWEAKITRLKAAQANLKKL